MDQRREITDVLRQRIVSGLHLGILSPGDRFASTRDIAEEFGVAPRTAMAAYRTLETEGLIERRERSGIYIAAARVPEGAMLTQLAGWLVEVLVEARGREIPPIGFPERVRRCLETLRMRAACITGNHDQYHELYSELREDYGIESDSIDAETLEGRAAQTTLTRTDLIVATSLHATLAQQLGAKWRKPVVVTRLRRDIMSNLTQSLKKGPVYFLATDPRFGEALHTIFAPAGLEKNVRLVIVGAGLPTVPEGAPVMVMRSAVASIAGTALAGRATVNQRVFSSETARELLTVVVRANMAALMGRLNDPAG
ncbi:MAG: GntR family transcriptional regulator [Gemmatimonadaceae bacterium]